MDSSAPKDQPPKLEASTVDTKWCVMCTEYVDYGHCCDPANPDNYDTEEKPAHE